MEWHDWWRIALLLVSAACVVILLIRFPLTKTHWGEDKRDLWFLLLMWSLASFAMQIEGIVRDSPLRFRLVFVSAAAIVTLKFLTKKGHAEDNTNLQ